MYKHKQADGFSLIELLVAISITALLVLVSMPFTASWVGNTNISSAENRIHEALGRAKSLAMRNPEGVTTNGHAAAALCFNNTTKVLSVHGASTTGGVTSPAECNTPSPSQWSTTLPDTVTLIRDPNGTNAAFTCACIDSKGLYTTTSTSCNACASNNQMKISASNGGVYETLSIF